MSKPESFPARSLAIADLQLAYRSGRTTPAQVIEALRARDATIPRERAIWISRVPLERMLEQARALESVDPGALPLYGIPFAIKDNIDLAGVATTAGCPDFSHMPAESAFVVHRLIAAGAIPVGKTNLDQFATGLVGTRSPYGACRNSFDPDYISGGSSSGSALAVALGLASFSLGSDTAGSGRIPAAFNNLVGLKPSCGRLSPRGMIPACRTLDAVSVFALSAEDAARVCRVAEGFDAAEPYSRKAGAPERVMSFASGTFRFGVPRSGQLEFFGDESYRRLFGEAVARLGRLGGKPLEIDYSPFLETARLLYEGPWVAERYVAIAALLRDSPDSVHPVTRQIIEPGARLTAAQAFRAQYRLQQLRRQAAQVWNDIDVLLTPTAGTIYRLSDVAAEPVRLNSNLGFYTNFVNLLDLAAVAVPAGFTGTGLPFGVTLTGPTWSDYELLRLAAAFHDRTAPAGATQQTLPDEADFDWCELQPGIPVAVCGAHMEGLPLNHQLRERGAVLLQRTRTAPLYRLFALPGGPPRRPGLLRVASQGEAIEVEVWSVPPGLFGSFVAQVPSPLAIGKVLLANRSAVSGFLCEPEGLAGAEDITACGGWRAYLACGGP